MSGLPLGGPRDLARFSLVSEGEEADGEEKFHRGGHYGDFDPLVCGQIDQRDVGFLAVDRKTIRKYLAPAIEAGMKPGSKTPTAPQWAQLVEGWFPQLTDTRLRQVTWPEIDKHAEYVKAQLATGVTQSTVAAVARRARPGGVGGIVSPLGPCDAAGGGPPDGGDGAARRRGPG